MIAASQATEVVRYTDARIHGRAAHRADCCLFVPPARKSFAQCMATDPRIRRRGVFTGWSISVQSEAPLRVHPLAVSPIWKPRGDLEATPFTAWSRSFALLARRLRRFGRARRDLALRPATYGIPSRGAWPQAASPHGARPGPRSQPPLVRTGISAPMELWCQPGGSKADQGPRWARDEAPTA